MSAKSQQDFLDLAARLLPDDYLAPLIDPGPGYEVIQAHAQVAARASLAVDRLEGGAFVLSAPAAARATVQVFFKRQNANAGAVTIKAGTVVGTAEKVKFVTTADVAFGALDLQTATVAARATDAGYEWNVRGEYTAKDGTVIPGPISVVYELIEEPAYGDPTVEVSHAAAASGGVPGMLEQLGADRGMPRRPGEPVEVYRARIQKLPDTVTPDALKRAIATVLAPYNASATFIETFEPTYQTCYDAPPNPPSSSEATTFVLDDPRDPTPFRNRLLSEEDQRAAFVVVLPILEPILDVGPALDDTALTPAEHVSPTTGGRRATSAFDLPQTLAADVLPGCLDGYDVERRALFAGLYDLLQAIKAAGVLVALELQGQ